MGKKFAKVMLFSTQLKLKFELSLAKSLYVQIQIAASNRTASSGGSHSGKKGFDA